MKVCSLYQVENSNLLWFSLKVEDPEWEVEEGSQMISSGRRPITETRSEVIALHILSFFLCVYVYLHILTIFFLALLLTLMLLFKLLEVMFIIHMSIRAFCSIVFPFIALLMSFLVASSITWRNVEIPNYNCAFVYYSSQLHQFLRHVLSSFISPHT